MSTTDTANLSREISRRLGALLKKQVGRGPEWSRAYIDDELVTVLVAGGLTTAERALVDDEKEEVVHDLRRALQDQIAETGTEIVEEVTGRRVLTMLSDHSRVPDVAIYAFVLEPGIGNGPREG